MKNFMNNKKQLLLTLLVLTINSFALHASENKETQHQSIFSKDYKQYSNEHINNNGNYFNQELFNFSTNSNNKTNNSTLNNNNLKDNCENKDKNDKQIIPNGEYTKEADDIDFNIDIQDFFYNKYIYKFSY